MHFFECLALCGIVIGGCAGAKTSPAPSTPQAGTQAGTSLSNPITTCGPRESYAYIARQFTCPDGSNPFRGNIEQARKAREGSQPSQRNDHIIDLYRVPCAGGDVFAYVDMYGCQKQEKTLREFQNQEFGPEATELLRAYSSGQFTTVVERCQTRSSGSAPDKDTLCLWLSPAALEVLGRTGAADLQLKSTCSAMPVASPHSDARAKLVVLVVMTLTNSVKSGQYQPSEERRRALPGQYADLCEVPETQLRSVIQHLR